MSKKEFIWLVIRFAGISKLILSVRAIVSAILTFFIMLTIFPASEGTGAVVLLGLSAMVLDGVFKILIVVYLLFFGKAIFNIVNRTSIPTLDAALEKPDCTEILIRFLGVWWLWRIACQIFRLISGLFYALILYHPDWLMGASAIEITKSQAWEELFSKLNNNLYPLQISMVLSVLLNILVYSILAWYFLKHGGFFNNWLNRLWLGKDSADVSEVPEGHK